MRRCIVFAVLSLHLSVTCLAKAPEPATISPALLHYLTNAYLEERVPQYVDPMVAAHERTNQISRDLSMELARTKDEKAYNEAVWKQRQESAAALEWGLEKLFWPTQKQLLKRMETSLKREVRIGDYTTIDPAMFGDDRELMFLIFEAKKNLTHDLEARVAWEMGTPRPEFYGVCDYAEGFRVELERARCVSVLR